MTFGLVIAIILDGFSNISTDVGEDDEHERLRINTELSDEIKI